MEDKSTFFIRALSKDGGKTWEDQFELRFDNGQQAQEEVQRTNRYLAGLPSSRPRSSWRYRVRKIVNTDNDNFVAREIAKGYKFIDSDRLPSYADLGYWQLAHVDPDNSRQIRFFRTIEDAVECSYTSMSMSRFFSYCGIDVSEFEDYLIELGYYDGTAEFKILRDEWEIEKAYRSGPTSCMNDDEEYEFEEGGHPTRVYASPDLGLAVMMRGTDCVARTVVFPARKIYCRIYGHAKLLESELKKLGYRQTLAQSAWYGGRLLKIKTYREFVCPYLDMSNTVSESRCGNYLRLAAGRGKYTSQETCGETWHSSR